MNGSPRSMTFIVASSFLLVGVTFTIRNIEGNAARFIVVLDDIRESMPMSPIFFWLAKQQLR